MRLRGLDGEVIDGDLVAVAADEQPDQARCKDILRTGDHFGAIDAQCQPIANRPDGQLVDGCAWAKSVREPFALAAAGVAAGAGEASAPTVGSARCATTALAVRGVARASGSCEIGVPAAAALVFGNAAPSVRSSANGLPS